MSPYVEKFFGEVLALPFTDHMVVGDSYYAAPTPDVARRLRIDFAPTIRHGEYDGLRLRVIHPDQGAVDTAVLAFAEHGTFARRDAAHGLAAGRDGYAVFRDWNSARSSEPPWKGADGSALRVAIERYARLWFPTPPTPSRPAARPAAQAKPTSGASPRTR